MISFIRNRFKKKGSQIIIWIALFSLVGVASLPSLFKQLFGPEDWVIDVNGTKITRNEFAQKIEEEKRYIEYFRQQFGPDAAKLFANLNLNPKELAKDALINEVLIKNAAKKVNLQYDSEFLHNELTKRIPPELLQGGKVDLNSLSYMLGYPNTQALTNSVVSGLNNEMIANFASGAVYVPQFEILNNFNSTYAKRKYSILVFPFETYLNEVKKTVLSQDEIKKYFDEQNLKEKKYWVEEKREGTKWEFNPSTYGIKVTDKEIESYYNKNKPTQFVASPVQMKVRRILFKVKDPQDKQNTIIKAQKIHNEILQDRSKFAEYVKKYSEEKDVATSDGVVEYFSKGQKEPIFEKAAFALKNDIDISPVIETSEGIEILQRVSKKPLTFKKLDDVKQQIKETLEKDKFNKLFNIDIKNFINKKQDANEFNEFAKRKGAKEIKLGLMGNNNSEIAQKLFSIKSEGSATSYIENGKGILLRLNKLNNSYAPSLDSVKKTVESDIYIDKAKQKLNADIEKAKVSSDSFEQIKKDLNLNLKDIPFLNVEDVKEIEKLQKENIPTNILFSLVKPGQIIDFIGENNGYLIKLTQIENFDSSKFEAKKMAIEQDLLRKRKQEIEIGFIASLKKNAKIKINEKILQQFNKVR